MKKNHFIEALAWGAPLVFIVSFSGLVLFAIPDRYLDSFKEMVVFFSTLFIGFIVLYIIMKFIEELSYVKLQKFNFLSNNYVVNKFRVKSKGNILDIERMETVESNVIPIKIIFQNAIKQQEKEEQKKDAAKINKVKTVAVELMAFYLREQDLPIMIDELVCWADDPTYEPQTITLKNNKALSTFDIRHFGWNIGQILGYSLDDIARFISQMFPEILQEMSIESIAKNMRKTSKKDKIHLLDYKQLAI